MAIRPYLANAICLILLEHSTRWAAAVRCLNGRQQQDNQDFRGLGWSTVRPRCGVFRTPRPTACQNN